MASSLTSAQLALLKRLATREAARRQQGSANGVEESVAGPSSVISRQAGTGAAASEDENWQLERMLQEEKTRNDVEWAQVQKKLAALDPVPAAGNGNGQPLLAAQEAELAMLDHEIERISGDLSRLDPPQSEFVLALLTREVLSSSIAEHEAGLWSKKATLQRETRLLQSDEEICGQLDDVREGLEAKLAKLVEAEEENEATSLASLQGKIGSMEASLSRFLASLIQTSNSLYSDRDSEKREQLRHLIDRLINTAWDSPGNPWVHVGDQYLPSIVTFLVRANVAVEHPRDARNLCLVDFHR